jgi:hypothetical protein
VIPSAAFSLRDYFKLTDVPGVSGSYMVNRRISTLRGVAWAASLVLWSLQIACGGASSRNSDPAPSLTPSVTVSSPVTSVAVNGSVQLTATVQNSTFGVLWQVNSIAGGNATFGTIGASGLYVAPTNIPTPNPVLVSALLQSNTAISGSASLMITPPPPPTVSVSAPVTSVMAGGTVVFTAIVQNSSSSVVWEANGIQGGNSTIGTIVSSPPGSLTGSYHAPANVPSPPAVTITALLQSDLQTSGTASITITPVLPPPVTISVSPPTASVATGGSVQFSARVQNSSSGVNWQVNGVAGGSTASGKIDSTGAYKAPASIPSPATVTVAAVLQTDSTIFGSAGVTVTLPSAFTGIFSWRNDPGLTGQNRQETVLTPTSVASGHFGKLFSCPVDGYVYAQPLYMPNVTIPGNGTHNVVFVATEHYSVYAFDADANPCQLLWQVNFLNTTAGATTVPAADVGTTDIAPEIGITGTPAIDPNTGILYVSAETKEMNSSVPVYIHRLHALDILTGNEKPGSPAVIRASVSGTGDGANGGTLALDALTANQRAALSLAGGNILVAFASHGDLDPYHGWLLAYSYNGATLAQVAVFCTTPNGSRGGVWQSGAPPSVDASGNVFAATSNGTFDGNNAAPPKTDYGETLLKLQVNAAPAGFTIIDTFTPFNQILLTANATPMGSTGVLQFPDQTGAHPHVALIGSEAGALYVVNRDSLGGFTSGGPDKILQTLNLGANITGTPAYSAATAAIYVAGDYDHLKAFPFSGGTMTGSATSQSAASFAFPGASPAISSNGLSTAIVWALDSSGFGTGMPAVLHAYDATNLASELYNSANRGGDAAGLAVKFTVPTVANGKVYTGTQSEISVYGLLP